MEHQYRYLYRAVAFLDILGFQNKLEDFEKEAIDFHTNLNEEVFDGILEDEEMNKSPIYYSGKATEFIETFNNAILKLDPDKFKYYLFSDNICITAKNINTQNEKSLIELLLVISELYFEFVKKGYFLRGGIDYGLFIDKTSIALGMPLANAYLIENKNAVFPRIVLSDNFVKQLKVYTASGEKELPTIFTSSLVMQSCEIQYLNVFNHIFKVEDNQYLGYKAAIKGSLSEFENTIVPDVLDSETTTRMRDHNPPIVGPFNPGFATLLNIQSGGESGKSQAKFKKIAMEHYLYCMKVKIEENSLHQS